jgi:hypothetical protein
MVFWKDVVYNTHDWSSVARKTRHQLLSVNEIERSIKNITQELLQLADTF